jgi:hypothetical protein
MKKYLFILYIVGLIILSCSKGDDGGGTSLPPIETTPIPTVPNPGKSSLSLPSNNEVCYEGQESTNQQSNVTFQWTASTDTDSYDLIIINQDTNGSQTESEISETSKQVELTKGVSYSWSVVSKSNDSNVTTNSDTWQFYLEGEGVENHVPFAATIISPSAGSSVNSSNGIVLLEWEGNDPDQGDNLTYTVYFDSVDGLQSPSSERTNLTESSLSVNVESGTIYYWRVKTSDETSSSYTIVYSFQVN